MGSVPAKKGIPTVILVRKEDVAAHINEQHAHPQYLKDVRLPDTMTATADPQVCPYTKI
jgi:glycerol-3-phosphate dehydrogenase